MNNKEQHIRDLVENADHERVESYMRVFDRVLLYTIASKLIPKEAVAFSIENWDTIIKKGINLDTTKRTNFLEDTIIGRAAKLRNEPDGEEFRLHCLKQHEIAKSVIESNLRVDDDTDDNDDPGFDFDSDSSDTI